MASKTGSEKIVVELPSTTKTEVEKTNAEPLERTLVSSDSTIKDWSSAESPSMIADIGKGDDGTVKPQTSLGEEIVPSGVQETSAEDESSHCSKYSCPFEILLNLCIGNSENDDAEYRQFVCEKFSSNVAFKKSQSTEQNTVTVAPKRNANNRLHDPDEEVNSPKRNSIQVITAQPFSNQRTQGVPQGNRQQRPAITTDLTNPRDGPRQTSSDNRDAASGGSAGLSQNGSYRRSLNRWGGNCPPGLECLLPLNGLFVREEIRLLDMLIEMENLYRVEDARGNQLYYAMEQSDACLRVCFKENRQFHMVFLDQNQHEVMHLFRPCRSWLQEAQMYAPPGTLIGSVRQKCSISPHFVIFDQQEEEIFHIRGPLCRFATCFSDINFRVLSADETVEVGMIAKQWAGLAQEIFTEADNFGVTFPIDLDVRMKAMMLGACILIDFLYFEEAGAENARRGGIAGLVAGGIIYGAR